jgi:hypothetical protein
MESAGLSLGRAAPTPDLIEMREVVRGSFKKE